VVNPENSLFGHEIGEQPVQLHGAVQIFAERLFQDDSAACRQARAVQRGDCRGEQRGRKGEVDSKGAVSGDDRRDVSGVSDIGSTKVSGSGDRLPRFGGPSAAMMFELCTCPGPELLAVPVAAVGAGQLELIVEVPGRPQRGEPWQQIARAEVPRGAEYRLIMVDALLSLARGSPRWR